MKHLESIESLSSKGNQRKFYDKENDLFYKFDMLGYESFSEVVASRLLKEINYPFPFLEYNLDSIDGKICCYSKNFLTDYLSEYTLQKLFLKFSDIDIYSSLDTMTVYDKITYVVDITKDITKIDNFGVWLSTLLSFDRIILNEDRHFDNINLYFNDNTSLFELGYVFDNGSSLLSDTDYYSLDINVAHLIKKVKSKPFSKEFDNQCRIINSLYEPLLQIPQYIQLDISDIYNMVDIKIIRRVKKCLEIQLKTYYGLIFEFNI